MTTKDVELVKESWTIVSKIEMETVGELFYNRLFQVAPQLRNMFSRTPMPEQSKKLLKMLAYIVAKLDKLDDIIDEVKTLAKRHTHYGVKDEHYAAVGASLLWTLNTGLGDLWTKDLEIAWTKVYTVLSSAMIAAQHEAVAVRA